VTNEAIHIGHVLDILEMAAGDGHVFLPRRTLLGVLRHRGVSQPAEALLAALCAKHVVQRDERVYLPHLDEAERTLAQGIKERMARP
jgi:hypothetical protein